MGNISAGLGTTSPHRPCAAFLLVPEEQGMLLQAQLHANSETAFRLRLAFSQLRDQEN